MGIFVISALCNKVEVTAPLVRNITNMSQVYIQAAQSETEAEGLSMRQFTREYPQAHGWINHTVTNSTELSEEFVQAMLPSTRKSREITGRKL